jgi:hypothetical protein
VQDTNDSGFPNVPTAVSLIAQEAAAEDASTNDSDTELASKVLISLRFLCTRIRSPGSANVTVFNLG